MLPSLFKLGDKLIVDQDKKQEFAFKVQEMMNNFAIQMLQTKTYPWIDGLVKLAYAGEAIIKGLIRPLGALGMLAFAIYAETHSIELSEGIQAILYGAAPAWGFSRHQEKKRKKVEEDDYDF
jgi:hypothetical protein